MLTLFTVPSSVILGAGTSPQGITSGDFRGDGRSDVAIANTGNSTVSVLLSNGDGTFQAPTSYSLGANMNPTFITSADLNGDSRPDLIVVDNVSPGFVSVLINNGDGTFAAPVKYAVGTSPEAVAVADMNGDNKPDLVVANNGSSSLTVLINQGDGTFVAQTPFALPAAPVSIAAGDFNKDGKNDVALVANNFVYVYTGTGTGTFNSTPAQYSAGTFPGLIAAGNFRGGAGEVDLAVVDIFPSSTGVAVLLNNGDGAFASAVQYDLGTTTGSSSNGIAIGDLTGNGVMDLVVADNQFGNNDISVLLGKGDGTFGSLSNWVADEQPEGVAIGNFDGDGKADVAVVNEASNDVSFLHGNGDGTFAAPQDFVHVTSPGPVVTGDFNGDGKQDFIVGNTFSMDGTILTEFAGNGDGTFKPPTTINADVTNPATGQAKALAAAYMNGDQALDLIMLDGNGKLDVFMNNGNGTFAAPVVYSAGTSPVGLAVGDFNGDGKPDVAIINAPASGATDGTATIYLNNGSGGLTLVGQTPDVGITPSAVIAADVNGDGKDDLIVTNNNGFSSTVSVLISNGDGTFKTKVSYATDGDPTAVAAAPLRNGGKPDLAISTFFGPGLDILLNNGDGTFGASKSFATGSNPTGVIIDDVTRDGIPDVEVTNDFGDSVTVWAGNGDGTFAKTALTFTVGDRPAMTAAADFNGDGFLDLVTTNSNANDVTLLLTGQAPATVDTAASASATYSGSSQLVSLSATVSSVGATVNEGTETFTVMNGAVAIGSPVTVDVIGGSATADYLLPAGTQPGSYFIQATYNGTANFGGSADSTHSLVVSAASSTTFGSPATAAFDDADQDVTLNATVTSFAGIVNAGTETFTLFQGANIVGTAVTVAVANGAAAASYVVPGGTAAGSYTIQVVYSGSTNIEGSSDASQSLVIGAAATTTTAASVSTSYGTSSQVVALNATITSSAGTVNDGTETFTILKGATIIGSPVTVDVAGGAASANYTLPAATTVGTYVIQAVYTGAGDFATSTDANHSLTIIAAATSTNAVSAVASFSTVSQSVPLNASITSGTGTVSTGTATFTILSGATTIGSAVSVNVVSGAASANYTLPAGTAGGVYVIKVTYNGTTLFGSSTDTSQSLTILPAATSSAASIASAAFSVSSQVVALNATITSNAGKVNEGTETFTVLQGTTTIGSPLTVNVASGAASASYTLPAGTPGGGYVIQAVYNGTGDFGSSTDNTHDLTVGLAGTTTAATSTSAPVSAASQIVALNATITSPAGTVNEGTETFTVLQGTTTIGSSVTVNVVSGAASANYTLPAGTSAGTYVIKAVYTGTSNFSGSTDSSHSLSVSTPGQLQFSSATFSANESDARATITVTRTGGSFGAASVTFATGGGTAPAGVDYAATTTTINWANGDSSSKTVTVPLINHNATGATSETVGLTLTQASGATLGSTVTATLTIQETQSNSLTSQLNFSDTIGRVARNAGNGVVTVIRTGGQSGTVTVQYATSDGTALAGTDYTAESGTLTFGPNVTAQTISIPVTNNQASGSKTLNLTLSSPTGGAVLLTPSSMVLTIINPLTVQTMPTNLTTLASGLTHGTEALSIFVTNAYHLYLKRLPDSQGLSYWVNQLQNKGVTDEQLETGFISSTEYIQSHGGTGQAWVTGMYQDLLGRNPDPSGLAYWTNALATGTSAYSVAFGFAASAERESQRIAGDYEIFLGRALDAAGQSYWVNQFLNGARNEDVVAGFVASLEYYQNPNKGQSNHTAWVDSVFQDILHRDPSASELATFLGEMK